MYHLLCLATKGMVKVQQDEAYGEVRPLSSLSRSSRYRIDIGFFLQIGVDIVEVQ